MCHYCCKLHCAEGPREGTIRVSAGELGRLSAAKVAHVCTAAGPEPVGFHQQATIIVDEDAASELPRADYYRETYENKPAWQRFDVSRAGGR